MKHYTKLAIIAAIVIIVVVALALGFDGDIVKDAIKALFGLAG